MAWLTLAAGGVAQFGDNIIVDQVSTKIIVAIAGMLFTLIFWIMEVRSTIYWVAHHKSFPDLWSRPANDSMSWINAINAVLVMVSG